LGRTPTQKQFDQDPQSKLSSREVVALWPGGWREALEQSELKPGWNNQSLLDGLKRLAVQLDRSPAARDIDRDPDLPSAALYIRRFGSLKVARQEAGITGIAPDSDQAMIQWGLKLALQLGELPGWNEWIRARKEYPQMPSQWQVYRRFGGDAGAWKMFQYCLIEEASQQGLNISF
jgi:hypothetical protein